MIAVPAALLSQKINPVGNAAGVDANAAVLGLGFLLFALFNLVFFMSFYRSGYKVGVSFLKCCAVMLLVLAFDVIGPHIPPLAVLDGAGNAAQYVMLAAAAVLWLLCTVLACRVAASRYEKVDL